MKHIILATVVILLSGCTNKEAPMKSYLINPKLNIKKYNSVYHDKTVKIAYPNSIKGRLSTAIYFAYNSIEEGSYQNASWSSSNSELLNSVIVRAVENSKIFKIVVDYRSTALTDYSLESSIYEMYHKVEDGKSLSILSIRFDLIESSSNLLVKSKKFSYQIPTKNIDALGYVQATNRAAQKLAQDLVRWLSQ